MRQSEEIRAFKNELANYNFYKDRIKALNGLIEFCYDMIGGKPKGVDPSSEPGQPNPNNDYYWKVDAEIKRHEINKRLTQDKLDYLERILSQMDYKEAVIEVYANKRTIASVSQELYISPNGLYKQMNKAIREALKKDIS